MSKAKGILVAAALAVMSLPAPALATKCVNPAGSGGCFASIQAAIDAAAPGETVAIRPGVYRETLLVNKTVQLAGTGTTPRVVVIDGGAAPASTVAVSAADVRIRNLTVRNAGTGLIVVTASGARLNRLVVRGASGPCIQTSAADTRLVGVRASACSTGVEAVGAGLVVQRSKVSQMVGNGVSANGDGYTVAGTRAENCGGRGIFAVGSGTIAGCTVSGAGSDGINADGPAVAVRGNVVSGVGGTGIMLVSESPSVTDNRVVSALNGLISACGAGCAGGEVLRNGVAQCRALGLLASHMSGTATVSGNSVDGALALGLVVSGGAAFTVAGNRVTAINGPGMQVVGVTSALVEGNVVAENKFFGLLVDGSTSTIRGNRVIGGLRTGFMVGGAGNTLQNNVARDTNYPLCDSGTGTVLVGNSFTTSTCPP